MLRIDFFKKEEDDVTRGRSLARAKSFARAGSLGWDMEAVVLPVG